MEYFIRRVKIKLSIEITVSSSFYNNTKLIYLYYYTWNIFNVYLSTFNLLKQLVYLFGGCLASTCINKAKKLNWNSFLPLEKLIVENKRNATHFDWCNLQSKLDYQLKLKKNFHPIIIFFLRECEAEKLNVYSLVNVAVNKGAVCCQWLQNDFHTLEISDRILIFTSSSFPQCPRQRVGIIPRPPLCFFHFPKLETYYKKSN